jgi:poly(ribitol-phosphate) beta-N-acetylglucosaminyltransferase
MSETDRLPATPTVSFCVPTYNRARYLRSLLTILGNGLAQFRFTYEIVVTDNASTDDTPAVLAEFAARLPLRTLRHPTNLGVYPNLLSSYTHARGVYLVYVADDDMILPPALEAVITAMEQYPSIGVVYAPWLLHDLVADTSLGAFYHQTDDVLVPQRDHAALLDHILAAKAFPEIGVLRASVWRECAPRTCTTAYWAFTHAAEYLRAADVLFAATPYYVSISRYFADDTRAQIGAQEAEVAWDTYRGGLESILARAKVADARRHGFLRRIDDMIGERLAVAVRLRSLRNADSVECYLLALRATALGAAALLPLPLISLAVRAMLWFLVNDAELNRGRPRVLCIGAFPAGYVEFLQQIGGGRVTFDGSATDVAGAHDCVMFFRAPPVIDDAVRRSLGEANVALVLEPDLLARFPA